MIGARAKLSRAPGHAFAPAPDFGQHIDYVFGELVGMRQEDIKSAIEGGVIFTEPIEGYKE